MYIKREVNSLMNPCVPSFNCNSNGVMVKLVLDVFPPISAPPLAVILKQSFKSLLPLKTLL